MSEKRRDNRGRILRNGEIQEKSGRYRFKYTDAFGDYVRKNPFSFELESVIYNDSVTREALSRENERKFLRFVKDDSHFSKYYDGIYILFNTGLRISEFVGLTFKDIDFDSMRIHVDHQLQRNNGIGYNIRETKTESGERYVPMTEEVAECFKSIIAKRPTPKVEPMVDGYAGFLFLDKDEHPMAAKRYQSQILIM